MAVSTIWKLVQHFQKINKTNWSLSWGYWLLKLNSPIVHHHQSPSSTTSSLSWLVDKELHLFVDLCPNRISWLVLQMPAFSWSKINDDEEENYNDDLDNDHNDERICWQIALLITMIVILCLMIRYIDKKENYKDGDHQVVTKWSQMAVMAHCC